MLTNREKSRSEAYKECIDEQGLTLSELEKLAVHAYDVTLTEEEKIILSTIRECREKITTNN